MPALGTKNVFGWSLRDATGQTAAVKFVSPTLTSLNLAGFQTEFLTLQTALDGITLGTISIARYGNEEIITNETPTNKNAQIEQGLLVRMRGVTTQQPFSVRIPTVDPTKLNFVEGAGNAVIISGAGASAEVTSLIAALEAVVEVPVGSGEAAEVIGMEYTRGPRR